MKLPTYFISHGGGPWPFVPQMRAQYPRTLEWLGALSSHLPAVPRAILSISGHWEASEFTVSSAAKPPMIYDYGGFPANTYSVKYPAAGSPELAARVVSLLAGAGIETGTDPARGFDHGTFVPLSLIYPAAEIPVVSMAIQESYDPLEHIRMGAALEPLRSEGILIVGSGLSYHNMRGFGTAAGLPVSQQFGGWLAETVALPPREREARLVAWEQAPAARLAHPREDHLIPLMAVAGAAGSDKGIAEFTETVMGVEMASYRFG